MSIVIDPLITPESPNILVDPRRGAMPHEALKYQDRLDNVRARMKGTMSITLQTPFCARQMRREFNILSTKIYIYGLNKNFNKQTCALLDDLDWARSDLRDSAALFNGEDTSVLIPSTYAFDFVCPEALRLCRIIQRADHDLSKIYAAQLALKITKYDRWAMMRSFLMTYEVFKRHALKLKGRTMNEMLDDDSDF